MKKYFLLVVLGVSITTNAQILKVPEITQEYDYWCWAGVSKCVLEYYGYSLRQCDIAEYARNVSTYYDYGSIPCCNNALQGCNNVNALWGEMGGVQDILVHFGNIRSYGTGVISISDIQNNINQNRPFIISWRWLNGGGHLVVGHGIQNNNVYYMDPALFEGYKISTYENLKDNLWSKWYITLYLLDSPEVSVIENVAKENVTAYPNPTTGQLTIAMNNEQLTMNDIEIYNVVGQNLTTSLRELSVAEVRSNPEINNENRLLRSARNDESNVVIDVSHLATGMYYLKIRNKVIKFVKE